VVELDGRVVGAVAAFPADQRHLRRRGTLLVALPHRAPWRWPHLVRHSIAALRPHGDLPPGTIYIDALATDGQFRRRGIARALLADTIAQARSARFNGIALHTHPANEAALKLYARAGFRPLAPCAPDDLVLLYLDLDAAA
jgi:ribosomal protein S18 acetylase RimI-like enzyme